MLHDGACEQGFALLVFLSVFSSELGGVHEPTQSGI